MWDKNAPLQLLKSMPKKLSKENLERIQLVIDADKYKNSLVSGFDLCGMYAPFCRGCRKTSIYPCAIAYVNMLKNEGMDIEIDAKPVENKNFEVNQQPVVKAEEKQEAVGEIAVTSVPEASVEKTEEKPAVKPVETLEEHAVEQDNPVESFNGPYKQKIRIAVARKKI